MQSWRSAHQIAKRPGNTTAASLQAWSIDDDTTASKVAHPLTSLADDALASRVAIFEDASIDDDATSAKVVAPPSISIADNASGGNPSKSVIDDDTSGAFSSQESATTHIATSFTTPRSPDVLMVSDPNILDSG